MRRLLLAVVAVVALLAAFWAGRVTLAPAPIDAGPVAEELTATVTEQTVGRTLNLGVTVSQPRRSVAVNHLSGVVTDVTAETKAENGSVLFAVAGLPVRAIAGEMPFYRSLTRGDSGEDVAQLNDALVDLGLLDSGSDRYDGATVRAVEEWQQELGAPATGDIHLGELIAFDSLPAPVTFDRDVLQLGNQLSGGENLVFTRSGAPEFRMEVQEQQARIIPESAGIQISIDDTQWEAKISGTTTTPEGNRAFALTGPDGSSVCGSECGLLSGEAEQYLPATVTLVEPVTGPGLPAAAIHTDATGTASVTILDDDGTRHETSVHVLGAQDGVVILDGVDVGQVAVVLAESPEQSSPAPGDQEPPSTTSPDGGA